MHSRADTRLTALGKKGPFSIISFIVFICSRCMSLTAFVMSFIWFCIRFIIDIGSMMLPPPLPAAGEDGCIDCAIAPPAAWKGSAPPAARSKTAVTAISRTKHILAECGEAQRRFTRRQLGTECVSCDPARRVLLLWTVLAWCAATPVCRRSSTTTPARDEAPIQNQETEQHA